MRGLKAVVCAAALLGSGAARAETDLKALAASITAGAHTNTERVSEVIA